MSIYFLPPLSDIIVRHFGSGKKPKLQVNSQNFAGGCHFWKTRIAPV
jgi:hypothetical protein